MAFDLKERRSLVAIPNQLLAVSVPAFDTLLAEPIGLGAAEHEDQSFFNTTTLSGGPAALFAGIANLTAVNCAGSANGGNISYSDIITLLPQMADVKGVGPFCWYMSPRTFFQRVLGLIDTTSRPLTIPTLAEGLFGAPQYRLMGWPVFVTPFLPGERVARLRHEPGTRHFHQPEVPSRRPGRKHRDRLQPGAIF